MTYWGPTEILRELEQALPITERLEDYLDSDTINKLVERVEVIGWDRYGVGYDDGYDEGYESGYGDAAVGL